MHPSDYFISCDWGTSNFRLKVVNKNDLACAFEHSTNKGIKTLYKEFKEQEKIEQYEFFMEYLSFQLAQIPKDLSGFPLIISGMASANIGLKELPYAMMPFEFNGESLNYTFLNISEKYKAILTAGACSENDLMRGEEIQAIGLSDQLSHHKSGILILPGTHCKHIKFNGDYFTSSSSFMTGELFDLLSSKSILSNNVKKSEWSISNETSFVNGIKIGLQDKLTSNLFSIRVNNILGKADPIENYYILSGILIGNELSYITKLKEKVFLASSGDLLKMYELALSNILPKEQIISLDSKIIENAMLNGQRKILNLYGN